MDSASLISIQLDVKNWNIAMKFNIIVGCLLLLLSNVSFADMRIRLLFDGAPYVPKVTPEFACHDDSKQQWFDCALTPTGKLGEYKRENLAPGSYAVIFDVNENRNNLKVMPGDWQANYRFNIAASNDEQIIDVPMTKLMHLVKPQSNDGAMVGALGASCKDMPLNIPAGHPWTDELTIPFEWEPVVKGATYKITIGRNKCKTDEGLGTFRQFETNETSFALTLPPNAEDEFYSFFIFAFRDGQTVGTFLTYDAAMQGWHYGFKIAPVSTPASYYLAIVAIALLLTLLWFVMGYLGLGIVPRALIFSTLIAILVGGQQIIPNAKSYSPYKYFDVPPVFLANTISADANSAKDQAKGIYPYSWSKEVPKPHWWKSVTPKQKITNYGELSLWWQNQESGEKAQREFFKAIYEAIEQHPEDEQLAVAGMHFLFYLSNSQKVLSQVGQVAIQYHLHHMQRVDNCAGDCRAGDTIISIASSYAPYLARSQGSKKAIAMLESVLDARKADTSIYAAAELHVSLINLLYQAKQTRKARKTLDYALTAFDKTGYIETLKSLDKLVPKFP